MKMVLALSTVLLSVVIPKIGVKIVYQRTNYLCEIKFIPTMVRKILLIASALVNLISQVFIFMLHQDKSVGIEAIRELSFYILIPALLLAGLAFLNNTMVKHLLKYTGLLSLSIVTYIMSVHTGTREAASLFDHPQYLFGLISSIGVIVFNDID
jgi:hypothetical protein